MKRISVFAIILVLTITHITAGHVHYRGFSYRRLRWSIHAHGLVPNDLYYNPRAHGYGRTGLVPYWVRYNPYAHGVKNPSGLVNDYTCSTGSIYYCPEKVIYRGCCSTDAHLNSSARDCEHNSADTEQMRADYLAKIKTRREQLQQLAQARKQERALNRSIGKETIIAYLKDNDVNFRMNRLLSIEGKVLSADFILDEGDTVISYWDPAAIEALGGQDKHRMNLYQNYVNSWKNFCSEYQRAGGEIFQIISSDREEILAQLTLRNEPGETRTTYANAHTELQP